MTEPLQQKRAGLALFIASLITFADIHMGQPLLPLFAEQFHLTPATASLAVSLVIFPLGLSFLFYSPLADVVGKKKLMSTVLFLSSFPGLLTALAGSFGLVLAGRLADGLLLAGVPSVAMGYIGEEFDKNSSPNPKKLTRPRRRVFASLTRSGPG